MIEIFEKRGDNVVLYTTVEDEFAARHEVATLGTITEVSTWGGYRYVIVAGRLFRWAVPAT